VVVKKKLTIREKKWNAEFKGEMIEKGALPPDKARLNRKKFANEVLKEYKESLSSWDDITYLYQAINWMVPSENIEFKIELEQVGVLKLLKIAMDIKTFNGKMVKKGKTKYNPYDMYKEVVEPILKL